jgi:hypothetical protein
MRSISYSFVKILGHVLIPTPGSSCIAIRFKEEETDRSYHLKFGGKPLRKMEAIRPLDRDTFLITGWIHNDNPHEIVVETVHLKERSTLAFWNKVNNLFSFQNPRSAAADKLEELSQKSHDANTILNDPAAAQSAYRKAALATHPDLGGCEKQFREASQAYELLKFNQSTN